MEITVAVKDSFDIKPALIASNHTPGVIVIFDGRQCGFQLPLLGAVVKLLRPDGSEIQARIEEQKEHGEGRSFFFSGLRREDVPIGTILSWESRRSTLQSYSVHAGGV